MSNQKRNGCSVGQVRISDRCYDAKRRGQYIDFFQAANCYTALRHMKDSYDSGKDLNSPKFGKIAESVINACLIQTKEPVSNKIPLHFKGMDAVGKHTKRYPQKGTLPSGHRGDLIKIRNGHGTLTFFPSS